VYSQAAPQACTCSSLTKLEFTPVAPMEALSRIYVGLCQCGGMNCVVTAGAMQCTK
jgi:hypothetical protein